MQEVTFFRRFCSWSLVSPWITYACRYSLRYPCPHFASKSDSMRAWVYQLGGRQACVDPRASGPLTCSLPSSCRTWYVRSLARSVTQPASFAVSFRSSSPFASYFALGWSNIRSIFPFHVGFQSTMQALSWNRPSTCLLASNALGQSSFYSHPALVFIDLPRWLPWRRRSREIRPRSHPCPAWCSWSRDFVPWVHLNPLIEGQRPQRPLVHS